MDIKETISRVPTWGWIAGGGLVLGLLLLMNRGSGGTTMSSTGGAAPDANSILGQLQDAANTLGGTKTNPPTTTKTLTGYSVKVASHNLATYDSKGKLLGNINSTTFSATKKKINGVWWYTITSGKYRGRMFKAVSGSWITYTPIYAQTPTTTHTTSTVQTSNNTVS